MAPPLELKSNIQVGHAARPPLCMTLHDAIFPIPFTCARTRTCKGYAAKSVMIRHVSWRGIPIPPVAASKQQPQKFHTQNGSPYCPPIKTKAVLIEKLGGVILDFRPKEPLPLQCPPEGARPLSGLFVRLVAGPTIDASFCDSFNAMGRPLKKKMDPCVWAACSLVVYDEEWVDGPIARVVDFAKDAKLLTHKPFGAIMRLTPECGLGYRGWEESPHFSFWMASNFDPSSAVKKVVSLV